MPQVALLQLAFQLRYRGSITFGGRTMTNPLAQETAIPQQQPVNTIADVSEGTSLSSATLVTNSRNAMATLVGAASSEVDEAIRAIHGW